MTCEDSKLLMPEYWDGSLDEADRLILEDHLQRCPACRQEAEALRLIWTRLSTLPDESPSEQMRGRFYDRLDAFRQGLLEKKKPAWFSGWRVWAPAAAFAILIAGFFTGYLFDHRKDSTQLSQLRTEVTNMRQLVTLSLLQQQNATERLQGVNYSYRVERSDTEVLAALLYTINHDSNINVRMAAIEAMRNFGDSPVARRGLVQALAKQTSPLVQIALLDEIVDLKEKGAVPALRSLVSDPQVNDQVKQRAQSAIEQFQ
jgi:hypothetical protein